jgi:hypothetical protein
MNARNDAKRPSDQNLDARLVLAALQLRSLRFPRLSPANLRATSKVKELMPCSVRSMK